MISELLRRVWWRDRTCVDCGARGTEIHHIVHRRFRAGREDIRNLVLLCPACHRKANSYATKARHLHYLQDKYEYDYESLGEPWLGLLREANEQEHPQV